MINFIKNTSPIQRFFIVITIIWLIVFLIYIIHYWKYCRYDDLLIFSITPIAFWGTYWIAFDWINKYSKKILLAAIILIPLFIYLIVTNNMNNTTIKCNQINWSEFTPVDNK